MWDRGLLGGEHIAEEDLFDLVGLDAGSLYDGYPILSAPNVQKRAII